jgi:chemotaxis protein MotB
MNASRRGDPLAEHHLPALDASAYREPPRLATGTVVLLTLVLAGAAGVTGYCGWSLWTTQRRLSATQTQLTQTTAERRRAQTEATQLQRVLAEQEAQLAESGKRAAELEAELAATGGRLSELEADRAEVDARLAEFRRMQQQFQKMIDSGRLEVAFRRGRMTVDLPAQVLFPSGSANLTEEGFRALTEVANILHGVNDRRFIVAGHTDNVPVSTPEFADNWQLSTARALRVTEALIAAGMRPSQLVAAGHAEFEPVASNKSARGRQKNRRIEIILEPRLMPIPGLEREEQPDAAPAKAPAEAAKP